MMMYTCSSKRLRQKSLTFEAHLTHKTLPQECKDQPNVVWWHPSMSSGFGDGDGYQEFS